MFGEYRWGRGALPRDLSSSLLPREVELVGVLGGVALELEEKAGGLGPAGLALGSADEDLDELVDVGDVTFGPAGLAVRWHDGMYETDERGNVVVEGELVGRHAILARGVVLKPPKPVDDPLIKWRNSWGGIYGVDGDGLIRASALEAIVEELMFPIRRARPQG